MTVRRVGYVADDEWMTQKQWDELQPLLLAAVRATGDKTADVRTAVETKLSALYAGKPARWFVELMYTHGIEWTQQERARIGELFPGTTPPKPGEKSGGVAVDLGAKQKG